MNFRSIPEGVEVGARFRINHMVLEVTDRTQDRAVLRDGRNNYMDLVNVPGEMLFRALGVPRGSRELIPRRVCIINRFEEIAK